MCVGQSDERVSKSALNGGASLTTHGLEIVAVGGWLDGRVQCEHDGARRDVKCGAGHHAVTAVDGDGHYGQVKLQRQFERSLLERPHFAGRGAASLGEDDQRHAVA